MTKNIKITDARPEMLPQLEAIEKLCFSLPWTALQLEHQIIDENSIFIVAENENGCILGYVGMLTVLDEGYISNIAVSPEHRRRGVADALLDALEWGSRDRGLAFMTLEVRESNAPAISLYSKHGFTAVGVRPGYYEKPKENALLMTKFFSET